MSDVSDNKPYQGLDPFSEGDAHAFSGRDPDVRAIIAHLYAAPVTILYGPPGIGKTSVLRAGVMASLLEKHSTTLPVYFDAWKGRWLKKLKMRCTGLNSLAPSDVSRPFDEFVGAAAKNQKKLIVLILDQFEDYLLGPGRGPNDFDDHLAAAIRKASVRATVLIGIREDCLARLDQLKAKVPNLFEHMLRLAPLDRNGAKAAVKKPKAAYSPSAQAQIEGFINERREISPIELQIILDRIWEVDCLGRRTGQNVSTGNLIQQFVDERIENVGASDRDTCLGVLEDLAPERNIKTTRSMAGLFAGRSKVDVRRVVKTLGEVKILRTDGANGFTIHNDVIRSAVWTWCRKQRDQADAIDDDSSPSREELLRELDRRKLGMGELQKEARAWKARALVAHALLLDGRDPQRADLASEAVATVGEEVLKASDMLTGGPKSESPDSGYAKNPVEAAFQAGEVLFRYFVQSGGAVKFVTWKGQAYRAHLVDGGIELEWKPPGTNQIWQKWKTFNWPESKIENFVLSVDVLRLGARSTDGRICIWDVTTGREIQAQTVGDTPMSIDAIREADRNARRARGDQDHAQPDPNITSLEQEESQDHADAINQ